MITSRFPLGDVSFSAEYFSTLVGEATKQCYGVAAMTPRDLTDVVKSVVRGNDYSEKGVRVTQEEGRLVIELHIAVSYGLNISTAARSISHRVKDEVITLGCYSRSVKVPYQLDWNDCIVECKHGDVL